MPDYRGRAVFVGNLPEDVREKDLDDLFYKFGKIVDIKIKKPLRPPFFAFVEFADARDADDAARRRDGVELLGGRIRVEVAKGDSERDRDRGRRDAPPRGAPSRTTGFRAIVKGLPSSASWQDLKDFFRNAGVRPAFTDVKRGDSREGMIGTADFDSYDDLKLAIRKADDTEFRNSFDRGYVRVSEDRVADDRDRDHDRGRDRDDDRDRRARSRSPDREPPRERDEPRDDPRDDRDRDRDD